MRYLYMLNQMTKKFALIFIISFFSLPVFSQRYLSDLDSSLLYIKDTVRPLLKRFENIQFSGYIQPQFQVADTEGAKSYNGGDFSPFSKSRFMLRRARIKATNAPLIAAVRVPPSASITSQSSQSVRSPSLSRLMIARRLRPIKR